MYGFEFLQELRSVRFRIERSKVKAWLRVGAVLDVAVDDRGVAAC